MINQLNNTNFNFSIGSYIMICVAVFIPIGLVYMYHYRRTHGTIPIGSRTIPNLTINRRKTYEPPIKSYRESWIELPQANVSTGNTSVEKIDMNELLDYDLLLEAEETAKNMGLDGKLWKARKAFDPARDDELLVRVGDELMVKEIYDDLWCYGQNQTYFNEKKKAEADGFIPKLGPNDYNPDLTPQENEELMCYGMFPSVVLPIEFKNMHITKATVEAIKESSVVAEPIHDEKNDTDVILKPDVNSVVITIPSPPENIILPVNGLKRGASLRSSIHRRATNASIQNIKHIQQLQQQSQLNTNTQPIHTPTKIDNINIIHMNSSNPPPTLVNTNPVQNSSTPILSTPLTNMSSISPTSPISSNTQLMEDHINDIKNTNTSTATTNISNSNINTHTNEHSSSL